jgi:hypothetical protein
MVVVVGLVNPVAVAGAWVTLAFGWEPVAECLLLVRETLREIGSFGGLRLLPPSAVLSAGPSSTPATKGLTERSSLCENPEKIEEFDGSVCLSSGMGDPPNVLDATGSRIGLTGATLAGSRLSGRLLGTLSSLSSRSIWLSS